MAIFGKKRSDKDRTAKQGSSEAPGAIVTDPNQIHANAPTLGLRLPSHTPQQQQQQQQQHNSKAAERASCRVLDRTHAVLMTPANPSKTRA